MAEKSAHAGMVSMSCEPGDCVSARFDSHWTVCLRQRSLSLAMDARSTDTDTDADTDADADADAAVAGVDVVIPGG